MDPTRPLVSQFRASLRMLRAAIDACPEDLWIDERFENRTWLLAYHVLFYTHLYLSPSEEAFEPWEKSRENGQFMGRLPWPPHDKVEHGAPHTKSDLLEYADEIDSGIERLVPSADFEGASGFEWIPFSRFELHLYNLRHLQHHTGQLIERLRAVSGQGIDWVGYADARD